MFDVEVVVIVVYVVVVIVWFGSCWLWCYVVCSLVCSRVGGVMIGWWYSGCAVTAGMFARPLPDRSSFVAKKEENCALRVVVLFGCVCRESIDKRQLLCKDRYSSGWYLTARRRIGTSSVRS